MSWTSSFFVGVLTGVVGLIVGSLVAGLAASWYRVPSFEAQSAAFVVSVAILAGFIGFLIGIITSRVMSHPGFLRALGNANGILLGLIAVAGVVARLLADVPPTIDGEQLMLAVEIRWPAGQKESPAALPGEPELELGSITRVSHTPRATSRGPLWTTDAHLVDGRWVAPGAVDIFTTRGRLSIVAMLDSNSNHGFILPLSGAPSKKDMQWTEWYPHARPGDPPLADGFQYRYRVRKRSEPVRTPCYVLADESRQLRSVYVPNCSFEGGSILTSDTAAFRNGERRVPRGRINRIALEAPGLYQIGGSVLDTRKLAVHTYTYPDNFSIFPSYGPLGVSPDERSFVRIGSDYNASALPSLAVADFVGNRSYLLPLDERMRYPTLESIDPVAYGETGHYVSLSVPDSVKDTKLLDAVAKRLDVELATGQYDSLFGR
jgi:hypothetical protein